MLFFSINIILCSFLLVFAKNPIHSVLYLICCFINGAGFILFLGLEFLAVIFIIIYVGAIAVLFLFVVMMLDIKILEINESLVKYLPISFFLALIFIVEIFFSFTSFYHASANFISMSDFWFNIFSLNNSSSLKLFSLSSFHKNIQNFSSVLYIDFFFLFWCAGILLLLAMVGAIILTLNKNVFIKRQSVYAQINRNADRSVHLHFYWNRWLSNKLNK